MLYSLSNSRPPTKQLFLLDTPTVWLLVASDCKGLSVEKPSSISMSVFVGIDRAGLRGFVWFFSPQFALFPEDQLFEA